MNLRIISAGAGSGKTYRLTQEMTALLEKDVRASGIIATTFTNKAAAELQERVRVSLLSKGRTKEADQLSNAMIGTVHALGVRLLQRFAFEAGVSPQVDIIAAEDQQQLFNQSLATVLTEARVNEMEALSERLGLTQQVYSDWRKVLKQLTEIIRSNNFSPAVITESKIKSVSSFLDLLEDPKPLEQETYEDRLRTLLRATTSRLEHNEDHTKKTQMVVSTLKGMLRTLENRGHLFWHEWAKISKLGVGAKSKDDAKDLIEFAYLHYQHPAFHQDIKAFTYLLFELAQAAIYEFDRYKKRRGLIDYTDMETLVNKLLDQPSIKAVLKTEIDLLMVDEFQDTSPIQLEIFLKLSKLAQYSVWVGDPKQSIYGFRGADPELMQAIIQQQGGVRKEDIQEFSWRSRELIVHTTNALFTKAFPDLPEAQVALKAKRCRNGSQNEDCKNDGPEPAELGHPLIHWHFQHKEGKRPPGRPWMEYCLADQLQKWLSQGHYAENKSDGQPRLIQPGDVAILCRSNNNCQEVAEALHKAGLKAAISRAGLLRTAEARYILACLKYLINPYDDLSIAEILMLYGSHKAEDIVESRLAYLAKRKENAKGLKLWASDTEIIQELHQLKAQTLELSSAEILDLLTERLQLRRTVAKWGNSRQRLSNIDVLRHYALQYESACNRMHSAASTGGFLLWLNTLEKDGKDLQGSAEGSDTINVLTYHRSKGLEWPVVICYDLENNLRADPWGIDILSENETVDLDNVLGGRWLRYWVNPYDKQNRKTFWDEQLQSSPASARARKQALAEEARLLYVGITRARDYLIFPTREAPAKWLNRTWHEGEGDHPTLEPGNPETPWNWANEFINIEAEEFTYDKDFVPERRDASESVNLLETPGGPVDHEPFNYLFPHDAVDDSNLTPLSSYSYSTPMGIPEGEDRVAVLKMMTAYLFADDAAKDTEFRQRMADHQLAHYEIKDLNSRGILQQAEGWHNAIARQFNYHTHLRQYPVHYFYKDRLFKDDLHHLLLSDDEAILIQHLSYDEKDPKKVAATALRKIGGWAFLAKQSIKALLNPSKVRCFIHFPLNGQWVEMVESDS
ncbi:MAG: UvrD-helicase domain-containing protein [Phaeodactylibacter sp.]|nr:UvrD-helicase domain-containing protein [Phaeodactylibacter sp.]